MNLLAVDPSIVSSGVALFRDDRLVGCAAITLPDEHDIAIRCLRMADAIVLWYRANSYRTEVSLAFEWPQIYRPGKSAGDPNDLPALAGVGMAVAGMLLPLADIRAYTPKQWIGNLPKSRKKGADSPRATRIYSRLDGHEREHWPAQHDAIDAIGIGLHALGRLKPRRVFPGAK